MHRPTIICHQQTLIAYAKPSCLHNYPHNTPHENLYGNKKALHRQAQRQAVRQLLSDCLSNDACLALYPQKLQLKDDCYPYQLIDSHGKPILFVSFSHSQDEVALMVASSFCGIDIEQSAISPQIAQRFFHPSELGFLHSLPSSWQAYARLRLWQIKECYAKASLSTLSCTLSQDFSVILQAILSNQPTICLADNPYAICWLYQKDNWLALRLLST